MIPLPLKKPKKKRAKRKEVIKTLSDSKGNLLLCKNNGKRIVVTLKLVASTKGRRIGVINLKTKTLDVRRVREKHLMNSVNGYGFNHHLLTNAKTFDQVRITDNYGQWKIPKEYILENGKFLNFQKQGFELQCFLPLREMKGFERETIV